MPLPSVATKQAHGRVFPQRYHLEHHKQLGEDGIDTDLPTRLELLVLNNVLGKVFFAYVLRQSTLLRI